MTRGARGWLLGPQGGQESQAALLCIPRFLSGLAGMWGIWGSSPAQSHIWILLALRVPSWPGRMCATPEELLDCGLAARTRLSKPSGGQPAPGGGASQALRHRAATASSSRVEQGPFSRRSLLHRSEPSGWAAPGPLLLISGSPAALAPPCNQSRWEPPRCHPLQNARLWRGRDPPP